ncbi:uncharacterized protein LOC135221803 isoform X4 [Macrobrachium nipponense]|uniref:uncharacterized protein LOC135221803 isoform X4 n=1 Tax=Macrobrachium nipponense TaxID=159736 RepID=UPI0030C840D1
MAQQWRTRTNMEKTSSNNVEVVMKLVRCEWAPSLVVEWLCGELEERGIPGPTYAHTLLSLLHHHYCPHPAPPTPISTTCSSNTSGRYHHPLSRRHLDDFDLRDLDLDDLLGHTPHPDADLPEITSFTAQQRGGSRRARKRYKVRQKQRVLTSEQLQKVAAIQCLMSASDERYDLERLVEELCTRLKTAAENKHHNVANSNAACGNKEKVNDLVDSQESCNESEEYASSSTPEEQAEKYYAAFPPLSGSCKENCTHEEVWRSGDALCSCVWEVRKSASVAAIASKMPRAFRKKCREKEKRKDVEAKPEGNESSEGSRRHHVPFTWHAASKHKEALLSESYDTDSASDAERVVERRRKRFTGPLLDEDIGEGYIGDTSSRESSEDRDKGDQEFDKVKDDRHDKGSGVPSSGKVKNNQEEWECMGDFLVKASDTEGNKLQGSSGNRLFERGSTSGGTSGSSSDVETFAISGPDQDLESLRQLERKISDSVAQVWGQAGESLGHGRGEHVWDPPAMQELAFYTTIWGYEVPDQYVAKESVPNDHNITEVIQDEMSSTSNKWQQKQIWEPSSSVIQDDSLLCGITNQKSPSNLREESDSNALFDLNSCLEKSVWSDCNANDISRGEGSFISCRGDNINPVISHKNDDYCTSTGEIEGTLCNSYMKLGLENLWENTLGLESIFADLSLSNGNLEFMPEDQSCEEVQNNNNITNNNSNQTDSEHEKMVAIVEDVCKSYESQEEEHAPNTSLLKQLPSGPSGPQADLRHTENSGFSMVIPRGKSAELRNSVEHLSEKLHLNLEGGTNHGAVAGNVDELPPGQEEENLLTSPRTHFRPIRQESLGSTADDHYEDGTMFVINSERPDLPFQRTSSGALFLESDLLEGSPKKYMVYKEPPPKIVQTEDDQEVNPNESIPAIALVPKFKVVNNEKFCQTEEESVTNIQSFCKPKEDLAHENLCFTDHFTCDDDQDPDVFEFQHQDFPDAGGNLANIWKNNPRVSEAPHPRNIWQVQVDSEPDAWSQINDVEHSCVAASDGAWIERENEGATGWINDNFPVPVEIDCHKKSGAVVIPTSLASLWHHHSPPSSPSNPASINNLEALWAGFKPPYNEDTGPDNGRSKMYVITNPTTYIPGKLQESCQLISSLSEIGPWKQLSSVNDVGRSDKLCREKSIFNSQHIQLRETQEDSRNACIGPVSENPAVCNKLRLEVDREADELLGAVHAQTVSDATQLFINPAVFGSSCEGLQENPSPRPLHERMKKSAQFNNCTRREMVFSSNFVNVKEREGEREDLDDLAPGWEFNDGFEWEHQPHAADEDEELGDVGDDDDGEGGEILVYESADGTTYTIPVEYLDDSLYDQIFGTNPSDNQVLGGSLPDLPSGHPSKIHFSCELEEEWKKSGIPYKVQLPRKPRPGRWLPPSRRPCTFFMEGSCRRSDCKFSHDLASITCRRRRRNKSEGAAVHNVGEKLDHHGSSFEIDSEMDFPTLGSSCESKAGFAEERSCGSSGSVNTSHYTTTKKKKRKFITITKNVLGQVRSVEAERALRRRLPTRRERRRRHTEAVSSTADASSTTTTEAPSTKQRNPNSRRKAERHRASASGHDDGTVSDY